MAHPKIGTGEGARPIHQLGTTAPAILPTSPFSIPLETERRIQEGLKPKIGAWDRSTVPVYKATGSSIKEGALLKLTKVQNEQQIRVSGLFILYIPFGTDPNGQAHTSGGITATMYSADVLVQAT